MNALTPIKLLAIATLGKRPKAKKKEITRFDLERIEAAKIKRERKRKL